MVPKLGSKEHRQSTVCDVKGLSEMNQAITRTLVKNVAKAVLKVLFSLIMDKSIVSNTKSHVQIEK